MLLQVVGLSVFVFVGQVFCFFYVVVVTICLLQQFFCCLVFLARKDECGFFFLFMVMYDAFVSDMSFGQICLILNCNNNTL